MNNANKFYVDDFKFRTMKKKKGAKSDNNYKQTTRDFHLSLNETNNFFRKYKNVATARST